MNHLEDDQLSTNVSLIEDLTPPPLISNRNFSRSPLPIAKRINGRRKSIDSASDGWNVVELPHEQENGASSNKNSNNKEKDLKSSTTKGVPLKHQENTIDGLKKENFDLRLSIYFLEQRLDDMSPENIDNALRENVTLKVTIQKLTHELKKYKKMILELNQGIEMLQKKGCPRVHGMSMEEKEEFERVKAEAEGFNDENEKLSRMMADLSAENVRLRSQIRSTKALGESTTSTNSSNNNSTNSNNNENDDLRRKYRQAKLKIEEQERIIQSLKRYKNSGGGNEEDMNRLKTMLSDKDKLNRKLEEELDMERIQADNALNSLGQAEMLLQDAQQQLDEQGEDMNSLIEEIKQLEVENKELINEIQDREQEIEALEEEVVKLLSHLEKKEDSTELEQENIMLRREIKELKELNESHDVDIEAFESHINKTQRDNEALSDELKTKEQDNEGLLDELRQKEQELQKLIVAVRDREVKMATNKGEFVAEVDTMQREKELMQEEMEELQKEIELGRDSNKKLYNANMALKQKWSAENAKNKLLNDLLEQRKKTSTKDEKYPWMENLNYELKKELEEKDAYMEEYQRLYKEEVKKNEILRKQLDTRDTMLTNSLIACNALKEQGELMEGILYEQATAGVRGSTANSFNKDVL